VDALRHTNRTARAIALLSLGAFALHQLRYALAYGDGASRALAHQGHGYLAELGGVLIAVASATLLGTLLAGALSLGTGGEARSRHATWLRLAGAYVLGLLAIFCAQELAEGALASGHPGGIAAVLANGGWVGLPLALVIGAACALASLLLRDATEALAHATATRPPTRRPIPLVMGGRSRAEAPLVALNLGFGFARRPPPLQPVR
jgi:hypothetical protein